MLLLSSFFVEVSNEIHRMARIGHNRERAQHQRERRGARAISSPVLVRGEEARGAFDLGFRGQEKLLEWRRIRNRSVERADDADRRVE